MPDDEDLARIRQGVSAWNDWREKNHFHRPDLSRADITEARSIPQELMVIAPDLPSVPIQPLLQEGAGEYGMFEHFRQYPWVLKEHIYASPQHLIADLSERVIGPAEAKVRESRG